MGALLKQVEASLLFLVSEGIQILPGMVLGLVVLLLTRSAANVTRRVARVTGRRMIRSPSLRSLWVQLNYVTAWVVGVLVACVMAFPDLRLGDIVGLLGLGSVAIGFAFQDIFKNFLAGILLLLNEPFQLGDQIVVDKYEGTVEEITIRSTQIRTYEGERIIIPNSIVFTSPVRVLTALPHRRTDLKLGVDYQTSLSEAIARLLPVVRGVEGVQSEPEPEVDIVGFGDSAIELMVRYWTKPQKMEVRRTRTRMMIALKAACDQAGITIPFPVQTVYFADPEASLTLATSDGKSTRPSSRS